MSNRTDRVLAIMRDEEQGAGASAARFVLWLVSGVYTAVITLYWLMYRAGMLRKVRLRAVVLSVGNVTVGGTGKTTTIQYLGSLLARNGTRAAVLSYGYRAGDKDAVNVVSDGECVRMTAAAAGDEAVLLARALPGTPVLIGRRRVLSGAEAERRFAPDVLLCDDAFQYWRLHRDVDLVLVDAVEPWGYGYVLPRGLLREPKRQLRRADAILITHSDLVTPQRLNALKAEVGAMGAPVWTARHAPCGLTDLEGGNPAPADALKGAAVLAVSSLGDPASFEATLTMLGAAVTPCRFADHHRYTQAEVAEVEERARESGLRIVTTAKDAVKLEGLASAESWRVLGVTLAVDDSESFDTWILQYTRRD
ncbi:MAG TPA: tetraacyldisaccharide 4'-kinase [Armatimonadota bacterium]